MDNQITGVIPEVTPPVTETVVQPQQPDLSQQQPATQQPVSQQADSGNMGVDDNSREGFISAIQAERTKATIEAQKAEFYRQQYEEKIRQQSQPQFQQPQQPSTPKYNPDEIPDIKTVEEILNDRMNTILQQQQESQRRLQVDSMEAAARSKYPDYDSVVAKAVEMANFLEPGYKAAILNASNPAEMAYTIGKLHPDFNNKEKQQQAQSTLAAIQANAQKPATLSQIGGSGSVQQQVGFYKNMPGEEWAARVAANKARA